MLMLIKWTVSIPVYSKLYECPITYEPRGVIIVRQKLITRDWYCLKISYSFLLLVKVKETTVFLLGIALSWWKITFFLNEIFDRGKLSLKGTDVDDETGIWI